MFYLHQQQRIHYVEKARERDRNRNLKESSWYSPWKSEAPQNKRKEYQGATKKNSPLTIIIIIVIIIVTQLLYESCMNWVHNPAPPASGRATVDFSDTPVDFSDTPVNSSDTPASAIISASPGAPLASPHPKKSRRRRRRRSRRSANQNSAPRSAAPVTPDERWANRNSASQSTTQPQSAANDPSQMMSTPVYQHPSFHSSHLSQPHFPAAMEIQHSSLAWTVVDFQGFISRLIQTPDRIWLPLLLEWTTQDLASPHLLCCNPAPNPSLDCLLGNEWLVLHERLGKLQERGLELCTHCCRVPNALTHGLW